MSTATPPTPPITPTKPPTASVLVARATGKNLPTSTDTARDLVEKAALKAQKREEIASERRKSREAALRTIKPMSQVSLVAALELDRADAKDIDDAHSDDTDQKGVNWDAINRPSEPEPAVTEGAEGLPEQVDVPMTESPLLSAIAAGRPTHKQEFDPQTGKHSLVVLSEEESYKIFVKNEMKRAFSEEKMTLEDLLPYRIRAAWRITREMARIKGLCMSDERLAEALIPSIGNPDPWQIPTPYDSPSGLDGRDHYPEVVEAIRTSESLAEEHMTMLRVPVLNSKKEGQTGKKFETKRYPGFGLVPPPVPSMWQAEDGTFSPEYTAKEDLNLNLFVRCVKHVASRLGIAKPLNNQITSGADGRSMLEAGKIVVDPNTIAPDRSEMTAFEPDQGRLGLYGLTDASLVRLAWPTRTQIIAWEELMVEETLDLMVATNTGGTKRKMQAKYGLTTREITGLMRQAAAFAQEQTAGDKEESRALMILRFENYMVRAREALDFNAEMRAMKEMSRVLGLSDGGANDPMMEFLNAVRTVGTEFQERDRLQESQPERKFVENTAEQV